MNGTYSLPFALGGSALSAQYYPMLTDSASLLRNEIVAPAVEIPGLFR